MGLTELKTSFSAICLVLLALSATNCGSSGSSTPCLGVNCGGGSGGGNLPNPSTVNVVANAATTGVNVAVAAPASITPPNVEFLGADGTGNAYTTGDVVLAGSTATVLVFGTGLTSTMQIAFSGPQDIGVTVPLSITASDGTPGLQFDISVASNAALGARTLILQSTNNDVTTFAGGLEVQ